MDRNLSEFQRNLIVILQNCGKSWTEIAQELRAKYNKIVTAMGYAISLEEIFENGFSSKNDEDWQTTNYINPVFTSIKRI